MIGIVVALVTLVALIAYSTGIWRTRWVREQEAADHPPLPTNTAEALEGACFMLQVRTPQKDRIRSLSDVA